MEVIAKKKEGLYGLYVFTIALSCLLMLIGVLFLTFSPIEGVIVLVAGVVLVIVCVRICKRIKNTPSEIIKFDDGRLICPDGTFFIGEVTNVQYEFARGGKSYYKYKWGKITIVINGEKHTYDFVEDVEQAQARLMEIRLQNK